jgi:alkylation response protein AidB-like acyl-CoA dehydrogenase
MSASANAGVPALSSLLPRHIFAAEHEDFRQTLRRFIAEEVMPNHERWEEQQHVDREIWKRAGELGFLCMTLPEAYGGAGADRRYSMILIEELSRAGASGIGWPLHSDIVGNYILNYGNEAQKAQWLPKMASGEAITAIAMTEPSAGSDLQAIRTRAVADGDHYIVNGSKTFITNGWLSDLAVVAVRTGDSGEGAKDISLLLIEAGRDGFTKGKPLKKVGLKAQDTCELFFKDVRVPKANLLGTEGQGFKMLMHELAWERLICAIICIGAAEGALAHTVAYTRERKAFGKPVASFQNSKFKLAEMKTELSIAQTFVDRCMELELERKLSAEAAAAAKYWTSDLLCKLVDECVQLHGGNGYMLEYPVARYYIDARVNRIYGGTNEIMKEIISRSL